MASPCEIEIVRTMKKSKVHEWTIWELVEKLDYSYSMVHLSLGKLVEKGEVERRLVTSRDPHQMGAPGHGYWLITKKQPVKKATKKAVAK